MDGAERAVIGTEAVTVSGLDRPDETSRKNDVTSPKTVAIFCEAADQPDHALDRIVQHSCAEPGLLDLAIAGGNRPDPAQVERIDGMPAVAQHHTGIGSIV